jgi:hypothetical protein
MTDTTQDIKNLQLKIWLDKTPMQRLHQFMTDNEALIKFWKEVKPTVKILKIISNNNKTETFQTTKISIT